MKRTCKSCIYWFYCSKKNLSFENNYCDGFVLLVLDKKIIKKGSVKK